MAKVTEIAPKLYRVSTFVPDFGMQFNQFLLDDEEPLLFHTGMKAIFPETRDAVSRVLPLERLRYVGFSHFESDECGALNQWLEVAPRAEPVCSFVGAMVNVNDFATRPARALADEEVLSLGQKKLRFLATPHVPHGWDSGMFFEENDETLLCTDLFFHPGDPEPLTESDVLGPAREAMKAGRDGPFAHDMPYTRRTGETLDRLANLEPKTLATMHGSSFRGDGAGAIRGLRTVVDELLGEGKPA